MPTIRPAERRDADDLWRVEIATTEAAFRGLLSDAAYARLCAKTRRENHWPRDLRSGPNITFVAEDAGQLVGYAMGGPARPFPVGWDGELFLLYVLPSHQRRGIGRALVLAVARCLATHGMRSMSVWSLAPNAPSRRFYEALGAAFIQERRLREGRDMWPIAVYGWKPLTTLFTATGTPPPAAPQRARFPLRTRIALAVGGLSLLGASTWLQSQPAVGLLAGLQSGVMVMFAAGLFLLARAARR